MSYIYQRVAGPPLISDKAFIAPVVAVSASLQEGAYESDTSTAYGAIASDVIRGLTVDMSSSSASTFVLPTSASLLTAIAATGAPLPKKGLRLPDIIINNKGSGTITVTQSTEAIALNTVDGTPTITTGLTAVVRSTFILPTVILSIVIVSA